MKFANKHFKLNENRMTELTTKIMADGVLSIFKNKTNLIINTLSAEDLLYGFKAELNGLQSGVDWLIDKSIIKNNDKGFCILID